MNAPTSDATAPYPTQPLAEVAGPVVDYAKGDICFFRDPNGLPRARQLLTDEAISELTARRDATTVSHQNFVVIRTNETLAAVVLMVQLSTPRGQSALQNSVDIGAARWGRRLSWKGVCDLRVSVPPKEEQDALCYMLDKSVGWMDEYVGHLDHMTQTLKKMRHAMADRLVSRPTDKKEVHGWLSGLVKDNPMLSQANSLPKEEPAPDAAVASSARRRPAGP